MIDGKEDPLLLVMALVAALRPDRAAKQGEAIRSWREMNRLLAANRDFREGVRNTLLELFARREQRRRPQLPGADAAGAGGWGWAGSPDFQVQTPCSS